MSTRTASMSLWMLLIVVFLVGGAAIASEQTPSSGMSEPTKQMREKMATVHERMAACLRSDKTFAECHSEMRQNCQTMMDAQGCQMMSMSMGKHGMRHMPAADSEDKK